MAFSEMMSKHRSFKSAENSVGFGLNLDNQIKMSACDQGAETPYSQWRSGGDHYIHISRAVQGSAPLARDVLSGLCLPPKKVFSGVPSISPL